MFTNLPRHTAYVSTRIPWCLAIPSHWRRARNKSVMAVRRELVGAASADFNLLSLTKRGIVRRDLSAGKGKMPASFDTYQRVESNDIIMCLFDVDETPRTVGIARELGMITGAYDRFVVPNPTLSEFLTLFYTSIDDIKGLRPLYRGLRKTIPIDEFLAAHVPLPPAEEQAAIVKYLAHATARIDKAIATKRRLIALLEENMNVAVLASFRNHSSTRLCPLKYFTSRPVTGATPPSDNPTYYENGNIDWYGPSSFGSGLFAVSPMRRISESAIEQKRARLIKALALGVAIIGSCGKSALLRSGSTSNQQITAFPLNLDVCVPEFVAYQARCFENLWRNSASTATIPIMSIEVIRSTKFWLPSLGVQRELAIKVSSNLDLLRLYEKQLVSEIDLLREFRTRLIADVVTGQVDVRAVAATLPDVDAAVAWGSTDAADESEDPELDEALAGIGADDDA